MLLANDLSYQRNGIEIFKDVNISLNANKIIHIKGRNGIGKTTLIKTLTNMITPTKGEIYWNGKNVKKNYYDFFNNLTFIMDLHTSKKDMTVKENIFFWMKLFSSNIKLNELDSMLNLLALNSKKNILTNFLSTGEIKKLELCRLIIEEKKLWILDEPYLGIDEKTIEIINETFKNHIQNGGMIIFSSHFNPELQNMDSVQLENYANN